MAHDPPIHRAGEVPYLASRTQYKADPSITTSPPECRPRAPRYQPRRSHVSVGASQACVTQSRKSDAAESGQPSRSIATRARTLLAYAPGTTAHATDDWAPAPAPEKKPEDTRNKRPVVSNRAVESTGSNNNSSSSIGGKRRSVSARETRADQTQRTDSNSRCVDREENPRRARPRFLRPAAAAAEEEGARGLPTTRIASWNERAADLPLSRGEGGRSSGLSEQ